MNTKKHEMKNRAFDSEKGGGCSFFHFLLWQWHIKTWLNCYQTNNTLHLYWPYVCPFGKFYYSLILHMIKETKKNGKGFNKQDWI